MAPKLHKTQFFIILFLVLGIGFSITYIIYDRHQERSWQLLSRDFLTSAQSYSDFIENNFILRIEELSSIGRYFDASDEVTRPEFKTFVSDLLQHEGGYLAFMWTPVVYVNHKSSFEFSASKELGTDYKIKGYKHHSNKPDAHSNQKQLMESQQERPMQHKMQHDRQHNKPEIGFFTPVLFVEPLQKNEHALGFNISSEKSRVAAFKRAIEERRIIASDRLTLIHQNNDTTGFILVNPVFSTSSDLKNKQHSPENNLEGFLVGRMSAKEVMLYALKNKNIENIAIKLVEITNNKKQVMVEYGDTGNIYTTSDYSESLSYIRPIEFAGHQWEVEIQPTRAYIQAHMAENGVIILISGLVITLIITLYIKLLLNQRSRAEEMVARRTAELTGSQYKLTEAQRIAKIGSWELDHITDKMTWSDSLYEIFEVSPESFTVTFDNYKLLLSNNEDTLIDHAFNAHIINHNKYSLVHEIRCKDGKKKFLQEFIDTRFDKDDKPVSSVGTIQDITEQKETESRIEHMAHHDTLTGLPNRTLFKERFKQAKAQADRNNHRLALIFIDLDRFKIINDSLGHTVGDSLLREVSKRLASCVRESDIIGRHGGDEFLVCLTDITDSLTASRACEEILAKFRKSFELGEHALGISTSLGVSFFPDNGKDFENLLRKADTAMYFAKEAGRDTYRFFSEEMNADMLHRLKLINDMRSGIDDQEFYLHYQPQVDIKTGNIIGAEALLRWKNKSGESISPGVFIPIAEESGLILKLGRLALEHSCIQLSKWREQGYDLTMSVNISALQLSQLDLVKDITEATNKAGIPVSLLDLELTESILLNDAEKTVLMVKAVKQLGVKLSIDDFGTGYSSLSYLKKLNADKIKIDRSFIEDLPYDKDSISIARAIIHMSHELGLKVVAEGIENSKQNALLADMGCDFSQGYFFSRPVDADNFNKLLKEHGVRHKNKTNLINLNASKRDK